MKRKTKALSPLHQRLAEDLESGWTPLIEIVDEKPKNFPTFDDIKRFQEEFPIKDYNPRPFWKDSAKPLGLILASSTLTLLISFLLYNGVKGRSFSTSELSIVASTVRGNPRESISLKIIPKTDGFISLITISDNMRLDEAIIDPEPFSGAIVAVAGVEQTLGLPDGVERGIVVTIVTDTQSDGMLRRALKSESNLASVSTVAEQIKALLSKHGYQRAEIGVKEFSR